MSVQGNSQESRQRLASVAGVLKKRNLDALLVRDTANITYLTAFEGVFDEEAAHALWVTAQAPVPAVLHTDSRYETACRLAAQGGEGGVAHRVESGEASEGKEAEGGEGEANEMEKAGGGETAHTTSNPSIVVDVTRESHAAFAARKAAEQSCATDATTQEAAENKASSPLKLAIEDSITLAEYRRLEKEFSASSSAPVMLEETTDLVLSLRAVKSTQEIVALKRAQAITDAAFAHIIRFMKPGMTEREVQLELEGFMLRAGAEGLAFPSIVAAGPNGASPHAIPGSTRLVAGQCVVLDFGARACGYCSDMTRVVFLGEPDQTLQKAWEVLRRANEEVETFLKPGVTGRAAHELAERILAEGGFEGHMGHGLGHGVGIEIHELPVLSPRNEKPLEVGNVVTVEPGIYIPGAFGMRLEDFGVITEGGFEVFTQSTHEMVVI